MNDPTKRRTSGADKPPSRESDRFDDAFRAWASRPPATPAHQAGRRLAERLPARTRSPRIVRFAVAAALVAAAGTAVVLRWTALPGHNTTGSPPVLPPATSSAAATPPAPDGDVLVIALDSRTTLYLNLNGPDRSDGPDRPVRN